ncbi:MAG TPA: hypothetical protein VNX46_16735, partial [Candidatus Acidoferrum sp.]|nr:hypothetical protein [Candidatus Acidoferrum sp.]
WGVTLPAIRELSFAGLPDDDHGRAHHENGRADDDVVMIMMPVSLVPMAFLGNKTAGGAEEGENAG